MIKRLLMLCVLTCGVALSGCGSKTPEVKVAEPGAKNYAQQMIDNPSTPPAQKEALKKSLEKSGTPSTSPK